jgi:hypothetical protein
MELRQIVKDFKQALIPILIGVAIIAIGAAIIYLLPNRTAAVVLGIFTAAVISAFVLRPMQESTQLAIMWFATGVAADAAYAKLNDQNSITVAGAVMKVVEGLVKLLDTIAKSFALGSPEARARIGSVTPDFVWALILTLIVLVAIRFYVKREA